MNVMENLCEENRSIKYMLYSSNSTEYIPPFEELQRRSTGGWCWDGEKLIQGK